MEFILGLFVGVLICYAFTAEEVVKTAKRWCQALFEKLDGWITGSKKKPDTPED